jgi:predicted esterase
MNFSQEPEERKLTEREKSARTELGRASSLLVQGNKAGALKSLRQALLLDPNLAQERLAINLAKELTGLPISEMMKRLTNADASKAMINSARVEDRQVYQSQAKPTSIAAYALVLLLLVLAGMIAFGLITGRFASSMTKVTMLQQASQKFTAGGYEYYMIVPSGPAPSGGWPVVVAFHGMGGNADNMIGMAETFTKAGAIFVAPTFGEYAPNPGEGPIEPMNQILAEVKAKNPVRTKGTVLLGLSQGGAFAFRFSLRHPEQVRGVVTAGAPEFDQGVPPPASVTYIFSWGANDGLQDFVIPQNVQPLQKAGYNIKTVIVPGYGHEITPFSIDQTVKMIK